MLIVHVLFHVKPESIEAFKEISEENAENSTREPGVLSFEVFQQQDSPERFLFIEIYKSKDDQLLHRETAHFKKWKATIGEMLEEPYTFVKYVKVTG
ncbi:MAG: putative quinol monooxygenase [Bacillota bacterium]|nr:putative quinol monooxygenase [Bacillota bacterium]